MRFWLLHSGDVPLKDQIVTQVKLGILSGELAPGERLPSVRALARRFHLHANTVSLAYSRLEHEGWLTGRRGSGMYVPARQSAEPAAMPDQALLTSLLGSVAATADALALPSDEVHRLLDRALAARVLTHLLLIEPDPALARIVEAELRPIVSVPLACTTQLDAAALQPGVLCLTLPSKAETLRALLPADVPMRVLAVRSVPESLAAWLPAPGSALVAVVSHWTSFLDFARVMLVVAGFAADALLLRDASQPQWDAGLAEVTGVVCDTYTATLLPAGARAICFSLLADQTLAEMRALRAT